MIYFAEVSSGIINFICYGRFHLFWALSMELIPSDARQVIVASLFANQSMAAGTIDEGVANCLDDGFDFLGTDHRNILLGTATHKAFCA